MTYADIGETVEELKRKYDEKDPFRLCRAMGIILLQQHLSTEADSVKGFFLENKRIRTITVNSDLPIIIQKIIVAHELGHATLHRNSGAYRKLDPDKPSYTVTAAGGGGTFMYHWSDEQRELPAGLCHFLPTLGCL